jgi:hypothetical protein
MTRTFRRNSGTEREEVKVSWRKLNGKLRNVYFLSKNNRAIK